MNKRLKPSNTRKSRINYSLSGDKRKDFNTHFTVRLSMMSPLAVVLVLILIFKLSLLMTSLPPSAGEQSTPGLDQDIFHYKGDVRHNNLLATLDTWGPLFRYSLDLKINSEKKSHGNANIP